MRKSLISVRVPPTSYQIIESHLEITSKSPDIPRISSKEYCQRSKEYIRTITPLTPVVQINSQITSTSFPSTHKGSRLIRSVNIDKKRKLNTLREVKLGLPSNEKKLSRPLQKNTEFDLYILDKEIDNNIENQLFPEELNEKIEFLPEPFSYKYLDPEECKIKTYKKSCQRPKRLLLNSPSNWINKVDDSIIKNARMRVVTLKQLIKLPRTIQSKV